MVLNKLWKFIIPSTLTPRYAPADFNKAVPNIQNIKASEEIYKW